MKFDPAFKRLLDEMIAGATLQVLNGLKHSQLDASVHPLASMTIFLGCFNKIAMGAPKEGQAMVLELLSGNLEMIQKNWGVTANKKEESRIILPFKD
jgi:hypothetical protein